MDQTPATRALLVAFWATWCPPCVTETPQLRALAASPPEGMRVVVVSQDDDFDDVHRFFSGPPDRALHLRLDPGRVLFDAFRIEKLPTTVLTVDGQLVARFDGSRRWDTKEMRALLRRLMEPSP